MGLLKSIIGGEDHPPLPDNSYAQERLRKVQTELGQLAAETKDRIEVVPAEHSAYVFIGKPPRKFGMAWISDGRITNLGELAQQKNFSPITLEKIEDELSDAYKRSESDARFTFDVAGHEVIVTPSDKLETAVHETIQSLLD